MPDSKPHEDRSRELADIARRSIIGLNTGAIGVTVAAAAALMISRKQNLPPERGPNVFPRVRIEGLTLGAL